MSHLSLLLLLLISLCTAIDQYEYKILFGEDVSRLALFGFDHQLNIDRPLPSASSTTAFLSSNEAALLKANGFDVEPVPRQRDVRVDSEYHTEQELVDLLADVASRVSAITRVSSIGKSTAGVDTPVIEFSSKPGEDLQVPMFVYFANIHGDEVVGREMLINFINYLADQYLANNATIVNLIETTKIVIVPTINPDGYNLRQRGNKKGVDLNRNFPDHFLKPGDNSMDGRQAEVKNIMMWYPTLRNPVLSANLHGGAVCASYPWDGRSDGRSWSKYSGTPDDAIYRQLAHVYANAHLKMHKSKEFTDGITNGSEWYPLYGGLQDWTYVHHSTLHITYELSNTKDPRGSTLAGFWEDNKNALFEYLRQVHIGVRGVVKDSSDVPVEATVAVNDNSKDVKSILPFGDYYRMLLPGTYNVTFTASGFVTKTVEVKVCKSPQFTTVDVVLWKDGETPSEPSSSSEPIKPSSTEEPTPPSSDSSQEPIPPPASTSATPIESSTVVPETCDETDEPVEEASNLPRYIALLGAGVGLVGVGLIVFKKRKQPVNRRSYGVALHDDGFDAGMDIDDEEQPTLPEDGDEQEVSLAPDISPMEPQVPETPAKTGMIPGVYSDSDNEINVSF